MINISTTRKLNYSTSKELVRQMQALDAFFRAKYDISGITYDDARQGSLTLHYKPTETKRATQAELMKDV